MSRICGALLFAFLITGGCTVTGKARVRHRAAVTTAPQMVLIAPNVYALEYHHRPVFYSEGQYWWYDAGIWYRSDIYTHDWMKVATVPVAIGHIERPQAYVQYRGRGTWDEHRQPAPRPRDRDHRYRSAN